jgi:hypothetical protein
VSPQYFGQVVIFTRELRVLLLGKKFKQAKKISMKTIISVVGMQMQDTIWVGNSLIEWPKQPPV